MSKFDKLILKLLSGKADRNFDFDDLIKLLLDLEFQLRIKGSHHIFTKVGVIEILNLQAVGGKAKPYQVKQVRELLIKYKLLPDGE